MNNADTAFLTCYIIDIFVYIFVFPYRCVNQLVNIRFEERNTHLPKAIYTYIRYSNISLTRDFLRFANDLMDVTLTFVIMKFTSAFASLEISRAFFFLLFKCRETEIDRCSKAREQSERKTCELLIISAIINSLNKSDECKAKYLIELFKYLIREMSI